MRFREPHIDNDQLAASAAIYSRSVLALYDLFVLQFSNTYVWRCPSRSILAFYNQHVSARHLEVGVGTGYFLDKCRFPCDDPMIALLDLNPTCLHLTAKRIARYAPTLHVADILQPLPMALTDFGSVALNYVLHCLPGTLPSKGIVFKRLTPLLKKGGVLFGATILGRGVHHNSLAQRLMNLYNAKGIFNNRDDSCADLERVLKENFRAYTVQVIGTVAFFAAYT